MSELEALRERVGKATGPDPDIDGAIAEVLAQVDADYTASIDAAVGLIERLRPGWTWHIEHNSRLAHGLGAAVYDPDADPRPGSYSNSIKMLSAPTPPLALLQALLDALLSQPQVEAGE